jgi:Mg-chelatase subunit ChlD
MPYAPEPQSVQRWFASGGLRAQLGLCAGSMSAWLPDKSEALAVRDVAADAGDVFTIDPNMLRRRPDDRFPEWSFWAGALLEASETSYLWAVSARDGRVAVLDAGAGRVHVLRRDGTLEASWDHGMSDVGALPTDIALSGDAVFLADGGSARVRRFSRSGVLEADWPTGISPHRMAAGTTGDVYVLGRGGWAQRYDAAGELRASWRMPDLLSEPVDITVGEDGRVFVAYGRRYVDPETGVPTSEIADAGIWVFEEVVVAAAGPPATHECLAGVDKTADPGLVRLGREVEVRLRIDGWCPGEYEPVQVVLLVDTSRSMNWHDALDRAKEMALTLVEALDPAAAEVAIVTFDDSAELAVPLTRDHAAVAAAIARLEAYGDSHMAEGIAVAHRELTGPRADEDAERLVVIISDGEYTDKAPEAAAPAREAGIEFHALALPHGGMSTYYGLKVITDSDDRVWVDPDASAIHDLAGDLIRYRPTDGAFETVAVSDTVPANMLFVRGSGVPAATFDGSVLRWQIGAVDADERVEIRYRLEPLEVGEWPTNATASADYRDALGGDGRLVFPVPRVRVWDESTLGERAYLPFGAARSCFRSNTDLDVMLVIDTSRSMDEEIGGSRTKLDTARDAAARFVGMLRSPGDRAGVAAFNDGAWVESGLSTDIGAAQRALDRLRTAPGTRIDLGLAAARRELEDKGSDAAQPVVILLTDGLHHGDPEHVLAESRALHDAGVLVFTIGLGSDVDSDLLSEVATTPADYLASPTADDLARTYRRILATLACRVPPKP